MSNSRDPEPYYKAYEEYAKSLRTWFVAFGIGVPVFLLSNNEVWKALAETGRLPFITLLFLFGLTIQVVGAIINKYGNWQLFYEVHRGKDPNDVRSMAVQFARQIWIERRTVSSALNGPSLRRMRESGRPLRYSIAMYRSPPSDSP